MPPRKYTAENNRIARARFAKESRDPARDIARKAKMAKSIDDYDPRRNDWKGVDTPGSKKPRKASRKRRSTPKEKPFSAAEAWRAHVLATHKQMGGSLKDAMRAASKTWIKKGSDPFTNFMAAGGNEDQMVFTEEKMPGPDSVYWAGIPLSVPLPAIAAKPAVDTSYVKELDDLEAMYAPKPLDTSYVNELNDLEAMYPAPAPKPVISLPLPAISAPEPAAPAPASDGIVATLWKSIVGPAKPSSITKERLYAILVELRDKDIDQATILQYYTNVDEDPAEDAEIIMGSNAFDKLYEDVVAANPDSMDAVKGLVKFSDYYSDYISNIRLNAEVDSDDEEYELAPEPEPEPEPVAEPIAEAVVEPSAPVEPAVSLPLPQIADDNDATDVTTLEGWQKTTMGVSDAEYIAACSSSKFRTVKDLRTIVGSHYSIEGLIADFPPDKTLPVTKTKAALLGKLNKDHLCVFLAKLGGNAKEYGISKAINQKTAKKTI